MMNEQIKKLRDEKQKVEKHLIEGNLNNGFLEEKEQLSIANAIISAYFAIPTPAPEDTEAYNWAASMKRSFILG